ILLLKLMVVTHPNVSNRLPTGAIITATLLLLQDYYKTVMYVWGIKTVELVFQIIYRGGMLKANASNTTGSSSTHSLTHHQLVWYWKAKMYSKIALLLNMMITNC